MRQKWKHTLCAVAIVIGSLSGIARAQQMAEQRAAQAANSWLALVDAGKYGQSWSGVSRYLKNKITKAQWVAELKQVRAPLGQVKSRKFAHVQLRNDLRGMPAGQYAAVQYITSFGKTTPAPEVVAMVLENDQWRVVAYFPQARVNGGSK
ncbi:MAG TPA: DUF4019 domain-containing protein [Terriglobia bacterium]|nr:DUF4019 domain-containing protein [Terriglobia bacterium]